MLFMHLFPLSFGKFLHIYYFVLLVNDFEAKHCLYHVFKGHNASQATIFVNNDRDVLFLLQ